MSELAPYTTISQAVNSTIKKELFCRMLARLYFAGAGLSFAVSLSSAELSVFVSKAAHAQDKTQAAGIVCITPYSQTNPVPESFSYRADRSESPSTPSSIVRRILEAVGVAPRVAVYPADIQNACASVDSEKRRVIYYGNTWLERYSKGDYWIKVGVLAHELGHHINYHQPGETLNSWHREYEADVFVGRAVRLLGGTIEDAVRAVSRQPVDSSPTHPARSVRETAVRDGYGIGADTRTAIEATHASTNTRAEGIGQPFEINGRWCLTPKRRELASLNINAAHWYVDLQMYDPQGQLLPQPSNFAYAKIVGEPGPAPFQIVLTFDPYLGAEGPFESVSQRIDYMRFKSQSELEIFDQRMTRGSGESRPSGVSYPIRLVRCG